MATRLNPNPLRELWAIVTMLVQFGGIVLFWIVVAAIVLAVLGKLFA